MRKRTRSVQARPMVEVLEDRLVLSANGFQESSTIDFDSSTALAQSQDDHADNIGSEATRIQLNSSGQRTLHGALESRGDRDVFRLDVTQGGPLTVSLQENGSGVDTYLRAYNAAGELIAVDDDSGSRLNSRLTLTAEPGAYYFSAGSYRDRGTGSYTISFDAPNPVQDDYVNAPGARATVIRINTNGDGSRTGTVDYAGDRDLFQATFKHAGQLTISVDQTSDPVDTYLRVYDSKKRLIAANDDYGNSTNSQLTLDVKATTYYFSVGSYRDQGTGTYEISLDGPGVPPPPPPPPAAPPAPVSQFQIEVRFLDNNLSAGQRAAFQSAAARWSQIIIGDLPAATTDVGVVDDLVIDVTAPYIDGAYGILGQAGPTGIRAGSYLPARGMMQFDSADLAFMEQSGQLVNVILHEMGHVLGIGTLWELKGLVQGAGSSNPTFTGSAAMQAYSEIFGLSGPTAVPLANTGSAGTRDSHWRESIFDNELMSGFLNASEANPISRVTIGSLQDLGYQVNMAAADNYTAPGSQSNVLSNPSGNGSSAAALQAAPDAIHPCECTCGACAGQRQEHYAGDGHDHEHLELPPPVIVPLAESTASIPPSISTSDTPLSIQEPTPVETGAPSGESTAISQPIPLDLSETEEAPLTNQILELVFGAEENEEERPPAGEETTVVPLDFVTTADQEDEPTEGDLEDPFELDLL